MHSPFFFLKYFLKFLIALRVDYTSDNGNYKKHGGCGAFAAKTGGPQGQPEYTKPNCTQKGADGRADKPLSEPGVRPSGKNGWQVRCNLAAYPL